MRLRRLSLWAAGGVGAMALVTIVLHGSPAAPPASDPAPMSHETRPPADSSLAGTTPDGAAVATAGDVLVLDPGLIHLFDYYLTTVGERPIAAIQAQVEQDLDGRLGPRKRRARPRTCSTATCSSRRR